MRGDVVTFQFKYGKYGDDQKQHGIVITRVQHGY
jgi:hypothetical protein